MNTLTPTFHYINPSENSDKSSYVKSIRLTSNDFSIIIHQKETKVIHLINTYTFPNTLNEKDIVSLIYEANNQIEIICKKNTFYIYCKTNTQIPQNFYSVEDISHIIPLIINEAHQYKAHTDFIKPYDLYNISAIRKPLIESIESFFPDFEIKTHLSNLFSLISEINKEKNTILIFVENMHFTALALQNHQFIGANGFHFSNESDFAYYIVDFIRKIYKTEKNISALMCGNIEERSPIFQLTKKYIHKLSIIKQTDFSQLDNYHYFCDIIH